MPETNIESRKKQLPVIGVRFPRRLAIISIGMLLAGFPSVNTCRAQPSTPTQKSEPDVEEELLVLEELIKETAQERVQLKQKLKRMATRPSSAGNQTGGVRSMTRSLAYQIENEKQGFEKRSKALRRKFATLKNRVGNMQNCANDAPSPMVNRPGAKPMPQPGGRQPNPANTPRQIPNVISEIVRQDLPPAIEEQPMHQATDSSMLDQIKIMSGPIDRLSLANNLFASGNIELALEVYKHIDPRTLTALDKSWLAYQIAGCHRLLGSRDKAERGYRVVTRDSGNSVLSNQAKWWLENLDRESKLRTRKDRIQKSLVALRERFDEQTQSTTP